MRDLLSSLIRRGKKPQATPKEIANAELQKTEQLDMTFQAVARRDFLWAGLAGSIESRNVQTIRNHLSRSGLVVGDVASIKDDREFLLQLARMLRNRVELHPLIPIIQQILDQLEQ